MDNKIEVEVFRNGPEIGKYYSTTFYTRTTGSYSKGDKKYFTTNPLIYVGKCIEHGSEGYGDNAEHWEIFENDDGKIETVFYDYEGTRCFVETQGNQLREPTVPLKPLP